MSDNIDSINGYLTFNGKNNIFAVPLACSAGIINCKDNNITCASIPQASSNIKYVVDYYDTLITIVEIPEIGEDIPINDSIIVLFEYENQTIGILSSAVDNITIPSDKILEDSNAGQRYFVHNGTTYLLLDICQIYDKLGLSI